VSYACLLCITEHKPDISSMTGHFYMTAHNTFALVRQHSVHIALVSHMLAACSQLHTSSPDSKASTVQYNALCLHMPHITGHLSQSTCLLCMHRHTRLMPANALQHCVISTAIETPASAAGWSRGSLSQKVLHMTYVFEKYCRIPVHLYRCM